MLILSFVLFIFGRVIFAEESMRNSTETLVVNNISIVSFLDDLNYIRLNISWQEVNCDCDKTSIIFNNEEGCNSINDIDEFNLRKNHFLVVPDMDIKFPADHLLNNCQYEIVFEVVGSSEKWQKITYKIPECVEDKCGCKDSKNSPYRIDHISLQHDNVYKIHWEKLSQNFLTVYEISYQKPPDNLKIIIRSNIIHENDSVVVSLPDFEEGASYIVTVSFDDEHDGCPYSSSINITVPFNRNDVYVGLAISVPIVIAFGTFLLFTIFFPRMWKKLQQYLSCKALNDPQSSYLETPLTINFSDLKVNDQYTPLEFVLNVYKFDEFEFPRNKVVLEKKLDGGAFGTVFSGKAFEIRGAPQYTMVAVKQMRDDAAEERLHDFLNEIEIMKRIGEHENIVRLLGCVTMDQPYMLIMELVPCGSLKKYLCRLREQWTTMKQERFFFPDNHIGQDPAQPLTYTSVIFENSDSDSYITPDDICFDGNDSKERSHRRLPSNLKPLSIANGRKRCISENSQMPISPISLTSSHFASSTNTDVTALDTPSPSSNEMSDLLNPLLDHNELQNFAFQIAKGMQYLESIQITHRDLAARNVLISVDKTLKISDFGLSRTGVYVSSAGARLPLRWMAVEAIEARTCDPKSDVWSFGVVLWEIGTLGAMPYNNINDCQILPHLRAGKRLDRPGICTDDLYSLMLRCWRENPEERPSFVDLVELLEKKRNVYVDFKEVSPKYVFPPTAGSASGSEQDVQRNVE